MIHSLQCPVTKGVEGDSYTGLYTHTAIIFVRAGTSWFKQWRSHVEAPQLCVFLVFHSPLCHSLSQWQQGLCLLCGAITPSRLSLIPSNRSCFDWQPTLPCGLPLSNPREDSQRHSGHFQTYCSHGLIVVDRLWIIVLHVPSAFKESVVSCWRNICVEIWTNYFTFNFSHFQLGESFEDVVAVLPKLEITSHHRSQGDFSTAVTHFDHD